MRAVTRIIQTERDRNKNWSERKKWQKNVKFVKLTLISSFRDYMYIYLECAALVSSHFLGWTAFFGKKIVIATNQNLVEISQTQHLQQNTHKRNGFSGSNRRIFRSKTQLYCHNGKFPNSSKNTSSCRVISGSSESVTFYHLTWHNPFI